MTYRFVILISIINGRAQCLPVVVTSVGLLAWDAAVFQPGIRTWTAVITLRARLLKMLLSRGYRIPSPLPVWSVLTLQVLT